MYVAVPAGLGSTFDMRLAGTQGQELGTFTVNLQELGLDPVNGDQGAATDC